MIPSRGSTQKVDQIFIRARGWINIAPRQIRTLWTGPMSTIIARAERIHVIGQGDFLITELRGSKPDEMPRLQ